MKLAREHGNNLNPATNDVLLQTFALCRLMVAYGFIMLADSDGNSITV